MTTAPTARRFFCGIDVAKRRHHASVLDSAGKVLEAVFAFKSDRSGFDSLLEQLQQSPGPTVVALEAAGHYWLALYQTLTDQGY